MKKSSQRLWRREKIESNINQTP